MIEIKNLVKNYGDKRALKGYLLLLMMMKY